MATTVHSETTLRCPICFQDYREPRKLPGCVHCFCENCILTFVLNLKKENKLGQDFECPVCRLPSRFPQDDNVTVDWVRTMELNEELQRNLNNDVPGTHLEWCNQCNYQSKFVQSALYCLNCQEYFCKSCSETLHAFQLVRNHTLIDIDGNQVNQLRGQALKLLQNCVLCTIHPGKPVEFFCEETRQFICASCVTEDTGGYTVLEPIKKAMGCCTPTEDVVLEQITKLQKHIEEVKRSIRQNESENKDNLEGIVAELQETKQKVAQVLDTLEDTVRTEGKVILKEISIEGLDEMQEFDAINGTLAVKRYVIENFLLKISPEQAGVCTSEINRAVRELESRITERETTFKLRGLALNTTQMLKSLQNLTPNDTPLIASVSQTVKNTLVPKYTQQTVTLKNCRIKKNGKYSILPNDKENDNMPTYSGVQFLPNNSILLTDSFYGFCCLADDNKNPIGSYTITTEYEESDEHFRCLRYATYLNDDVIAISVYSLKKIYFVSVAEKLSGIGELACRYFPKAIYGLSSSDMAVAWDGPVAFGIVSRKKCPYSERVYFDKDKSGRQLKSFEYMAIDEDLRHVIQPCTVDKAVYCFGFEGKPVFKYTSAELKDPRGVGIDGDGNVYVCDTNGGCIHIISSDGQAFRLIKEGLPKKPLAIGFSKDGLNFAVTCYGNFWAFVHFYNIVK